MNDYLGAIITFALFCFIIKRYITKEQIKELLSEGATVWAIIITVIFICLYILESFYICLNNMGYLFTYFRIFDDINKPRT